MYILQEITATVFLSQNVMFNSMLLVCICNCEMYYLFQSKNSLYTNFLV